MQIYIADLKATTCIGKAQSVAKLFLFRCVYPRNTTTGTQLLIRFPRRVAR